MKDNRQIMIKSQVQLKLQSLYLLCFIFGRVIVIKTNLTNSHPRMSIDMSLNKVQLLLIIISNVGRMQTDSR